MNKNIILISIITLFSFEGICQSFPIKAANKLYTSKLYFQAIPKYEKILMKDDANQDVLSNLSECYRLTNNFQGQISCYEKLVSAGKIQDLQKLYYGQALMQAGKYEEAKVYLDEYKTDKRGEELSKILDRVDELTKNQDAYEVGNVNFNSDDDDFSAIPFNNNKIVFASTKSKNAWINRKHGWTGNNYCNMYITENDTAGNYSKPKLFLKSYATKYNDGPFCSSKDGKTVFFTRNSYTKKGKSKEGIQKLRIFQSRFNDNKLEDIKDLKFNSTEYNFAHPAISNNDSILYFSSDMPGGQGGMDIWYCKLEESGSWGTPINIGEKVNTPGNEIFPSISSDNKLYFASNGHGGFGGLDVFESNLKNNIAGKSYNMGAPVNSLNDDFAYNLMEDNITGFLSSNRKTGGMNDDVYRVSVLRKVQRGKKVKIITKDKFTKEILPLTKLTLNADTFITDEKGEYITNIEDDEVYKIGVTKEKYFVFSDSISTNSSKKESEFTKNLELVKDYKLSLLAGIYDARTGAGIEGVKITLKDLSAVNAFDLVKTEKNGEYRKLLTDKQIGDKLLYLITIEKQDYVTKTLTFEYEIKKEGEIQLNELLELTIGKVEVGVNIAKMIDVKPIYFDLAKSVIRADAKFELNKIVGIMKEYPNIVIELGSHTDCRGSDARNLALSQRRAKSTTDYIVKQGISKQRVLFKGYGETKLLKKCDCNPKSVTACTEKEHAKNRRTEFIIIKTKK